MHSKTILTLLALTTLSLVGCSNETIAPAYETSPDLPEYQQDSFDAYVNDTQDWLLKNRVFMTENKQLEIQLNSPTEYKPASPNGKAVLLVHGLGDSPYSFNDIATHLSEQGYLVRTVLLPGHGSRVGDLI